MSLDAAAALMCKLGCRTVLVQSRDRAKVPMDLTKQRKQPDLSLNQKKQQHKCKQSIGTEQY